MTNPANLLPTFQCAKCDRKISLIKRNRTFRRHMIKPGVVCPGSWKTPTSVRLEVMTQRSKETTDAAS